MKKALGLFIVLLMLALSSCAVIGGIFKAGIWVGALLVIIIVGLILWLIARSSGRS